MEGEPMTHWIPLEVCAGIVEEAIRETLDDRFFNGTVEEIQHTARRRVEELWAELEEVDATP
ncbi:hypothetical protein [Actinomadura livida]|uniref:Uncharacterized protein n=2 Tax=Actinomadura livida TaxID=79909 RepID=A0A7W7N1A5_9ACTN|nr:MULTISPECIES: hypothetical protein [Actinomadura]MBB4778836.1 hypothetical protein [Actinomadura catellatispora]